MVFSHALTAFLCGHQAIDLPACGTPKLSGSCFSTSNYASCFPPSDVVKEFTSWESYFAHNSFIVIAGG